MRVRVVQACPVPPPPSAPCGVRMVWMLSLESVESSCKSRSPSIPGSARTGTPRVVSCDGSRPQPRRLTLDPCRGASSGVKPRPARQGAAHRHALQELPDPRLPHRNRDDAGEGNDCRPEVRHPCFGIRVATAPSTSTSQCGQLGGSAIRVPAKSSPESAGSVANSGVSGPASKTSRGAHKQGIPGARRGTPRPFQQQNARRRTIRWIGGLGDPAGTSPESHEFAQHIPPPGPADSWSPVPCVPVSRREC